MTTRLYQNDVYIKEWDAKITSVELSDEAGLAAVTLDRSAFFPEGGGQSCDIGTIGGFSVIDVQEDGDEVIHKIKIGATDAGREAGPSDTAQKSDASNTSQEAGASDAGLQPGSEVHCRLDWSRRFDNMQRHCGEHILSGIFYARCGGVNRGFHMGADYMTIDISLEDEPSDSDATRPDKIDMDIALDCEGRANEVIWSNAPVTVFRFEERSQVEEMPLRKALAFDEDISIVCVGSPDNPADCVACCGTHPAHAGEVGLIKIFKVENYKGMFRIYFEAGSRALKDYDKKHAIITELAEKHSSSIDDLSVALRAQEDKLAECKNQLFHAKKALVRRESEALHKLLSGDGQALGGTEGQIREDGPLLLYPLDDFSLDDTFELAKEFMGKVSKLLLLYSKDQTSFILVSGGDPHCGNLVREYASFYKGKGGGSDTSARAIFTTEEDAMLFADLLTKHLS